MDMKDEEQCHEPQDESARHDYQTPVHCQIEKRVRVAETELQHKNERQLYTEKLQTLHAKEMSIYNG